MCLLSSCSWLPTALGGKSTLPSGRPHSTCIPTAGHAPAAPALGRGPAHLLGSPAGTLTLTLTSARPPPGPPDPRARAARPARPSAPSQGPVCAHSGTVFPHPDESPSRAEPGTMGAGHGAWDTRHPLTKEEGEKVPSGSRLLCLCPVQLSPDVPLPAPGGPRPIPPEAPPDRDDSASTAVVGWTQVGREQSPWGLPQPPYSQKHPQLPWAGQAGPPPSAHGALGETEAGVCAAATTC